MSGLRHSLARILPLAWPVFIGQVAVLAFSTVDTVLVARYSANDLAALAIGAAVYTTIFVGFMGVILAVMPLAGQHFGAGRLREAGDELHQASWAALALSVFGVAIMLLPEPFLWIAGPRPRSRPRCACTCRPWRRVCRRPCCSRPTAASTRQSLARRWSWPCNWAAWS